MGVNGALGLAGGTRGIQPEAGVIALGFCGMGQRLLPVQPGLHGFEGCGQGGARFFGVGHPDMVDLMLGMGQCLLHHGHQRAVGQNGLSAAVLQHIGVVIGGEQCIDCNRHHACIHCS